MQFNIFSSQMHHSNIAARNENIFFSSLYPKPKKQWRKVSRYWFKNNAYKFSKRFENQNIVKNGGNWKVGWFFQVFWIQKSVYIFVQRICIPILEKIVTWEHCQIFWKPRKIYTTVQRIHIKFKKYLQNIVKKRGN